MRTLIILTLALLTVTVTAQSRHPPQDLIRLMALELDYAAVPCASGTLEVVGSTAACMDTRDSGSYVMLDLELFVRRFSDLAWLTDWGLMGEGENVAGVTGAFRGLCGLWGQCYGLHILELPDRPTRVVIYDLDQP
jgi:hypothetical protein